MPDSDRTKEAVEIRGALAAAVREAGQLALPKFGTQFKSWTKDKSSPVTEVDIAVDELLHRSLGAIAPNYAWLSEETADDRSRTASRRLWIVDPIDGTRAFIAGIPEWTIVAALVEDGRPIAGAVFQPSTDAMYTAAIGAGALLNGKPIMASTGGGIDGVRMAGPKNYLSRISAAGRRMELLPKIHSLALRLARVADGTVDVAFTSANSHDWDLAASDLLVHEAGGALTTLDGEPLRYNRPDPVHDALMAAGRMRHAMLVDLIRDRRAGFA